MIESSFYMTLKPAKASSQFLQERIKIQKWDEFTLWQGGDEIFLGMQ